MSTNRKERALSVDKDDKSQRVERALGIAGKPVTIDEICMMVFGRIDERDRNLVRVVLHRLDTRGLLVKFAQTYEIKKPDAEAGECRKCHQGFPPKMRAVRDAGLCVECAKVVP